MPKLARKAEVCRQQSFRQRTKFRRTIREASINSKTTGGPTFLLQCSETQMHKVMVLCEFSLSFRRSPAEPSYAALIPIFKMLFELGMFCESYLRVPQKTTGIRVTPKHLTDTLTHMLQNKVTWLLFSPCSGYPTPCITLLKPSLSSPSNCS